MKQRCNCQKFIGEKGEKDTSLSCDFEIFGATLFGGQLCGAKYLVPHYLVPDTCATLFGATLFGAELCGAKYLVHNYVAPNICATLFGADRTHCRQGCNWCNLIGEDWKDTS